jgi:predicted acyltransferase (DUF342 family)
MTTINSGNNTGLYDSTGSAIAVSNDINANSIFTNNLTVGNSATIGNTLTVGNGISTTGNLAAGNIFSNNYFYANGAPFSPGGNYGDANVEALLASGTITGDRKSVV